MNNKNILMNNYLVFGSKDIMLWIKFWNSKVHLGTSGGRGVLFIGESFNQGCSNWLSKV
jgi:hypothetical protein